MNGSGAGEARRQEICEGERDGTPLQKSAAVIGGALMGLLGYHAGRRRAGTAPAPAPPAVESGAAVAIDAPPAPGFALGDPRTLPADVADLYRSARRAFGRCLPGFEPAALAELEEHSMALWCAASCAEPFVSKEARRLRRGARALCDDLGEHRRLGELGAAVGDQRGTVPAAAIDRVQSRLARRQSRLQARIVERGRDLYALKPARVSHGLATRDLKGPASGG